MGVLKDQLLRERGKVDTIIVGDSRVLRLGGAEFSKRGWVYFNWAMSGMSPEDLVMPLRRAMLTQPIGRVVIGLSFENMTQAFPFEFSRYHDDAPFRDPRIVELVGTANVSGFFARGSIVNRFYETLYRVLPIGRAGRTASYLRAQWNGTADAPLFRPDGTDAYTRIEGQIAAGTFDFATHKDPRNYFSLEDGGDVLYLAKRRLAPESKQLFSRVIALLRTQ